MSFHPTSDWIVSVHFDLFYKKETWLRSFSLGCRGCHVPSWKHFTRTGVSKRPQLIIEAFKWNQAVLWPEETCVSIPCWPHCSSLRLQPQINSLLQRDVRYSDRLSAPRGWWLLSTHNRLRRNTAKPRGTCWLKVIQAGVWTGIKHSLKSLSSAYSRTIVCTSSCYTVKTVLKCAVIRNMFLPLSRSSVRAVETWCRLRQTAPCSRSRSPPPPRSQRSGRWAPRRSLSPPRSPTDSPRLRGSCCPRTVHGRTRPWFWPQPLGDLHTLRTEKLSRVGHFENRGQKQLLCLGVFSSAVVLESHRFKGSFHMLGS